MGISEKANEVHEATRDSEIDDLFKIIDSCISKIKYDRMLCRIAIDESVQYEKREMFELVTYGLYLVTGMNSFLNSEKSGNWAILSLSLTMMFIHHINTELAYIHRYTEDYLEMVGLFILAFGELKKRIETNNQVSESVFSKFEEILLIFQNFEKDTFKKKKQKYRRVRVIVNEIADKLFIEFQKPVVVSDDDILPTWKCITRAVEPLKKLRH